jgi:hypothetical protein
MDELPEPARISEPGKDAPVAALWAQVQRLKARLAAFIANSQQPCKYAHHVSVSPSETPKVDLLASLRTMPGREASVGRAGEGRPLHPDADQRPPSLLAWHMSGEPPVSG